MSISAELPLLPEHARVLSPRLAVIEQGDSLLFVNGSGPIAECLREDGQMKRLVGATLLHQGLAPAEELAEVLDTSRTSLYRNCAALRKGGLKALIDRRGQGSHRPPHKLTESVNREAQRLLNEGSTIAHTARELGVSEGAIHGALRRGALKRPPRRQRDLTLVGPRARAERDLKTAANMGTATERVEERALAAAGELSEAPPEFQPVEGLANAGVLLALPAMLGEGLIDVAKKTYAPLKKGFYGLNSVLLCFVFMALLRIKSIEQLAGHAPGELGQLLGLDRVPEVKTLRRKLAEMGEQQRAAQFAAALAERWAADDPEELGILYVDGHVNAYSGRKHPLPKTFVQKRRQCLPAATDIWVHNGASEPLFFVTSPTNDHLLPMLETEVIPKAQAQIRKVTGESRRLTLIFDREAWSPQSFRRWRDNDIDVITYRKGKQAPWPEIDFRDYRVERDGKEIEYQLAERSVCIIEGTRRRPAFWMREVRRLCKNGHQTAILTTRQDLSAELIAEQMFQRWNQENYFKYMEQEFNLDQLVTYDTEPADPQREVPNPERRKLDKKIDSAKQRLGRALAKRDEAEKAGVDPAKIEAKRQAADRIQREIKDLTTRRDALPRRVMLKEIHDPKRLVHHEIERKTLTRALKTLAYRSESCLARIVEPFFARRDDEIRSFLKAAFRMTGDLVSDPERGELRVRLYGLANRRAQKALLALCEQLNQRPVTYPGTQLRVVYEAIASH